MAHILGYSIFFKQLGRLIGKNIDMVWNWLNRHYPSYTLIRLITNQQKPEDHYQLMLALLALISSLFFFIALVKYFS